MVSKKKTLKGSKVNQGAGVRGFDTTVKNWCQMVSNFFTFFS